MGSFSPSQAKAATPAQKILTDLTYRIRSLEGKDGDLAFDPQFSPDGEHVLVKFGLPALHLMNRSYPFHLYLWERATNQLVQVTESDLFFRYTTWSPDSNFITYITGGDSEGNVGGHEHSAPLRLYVYNRRTKQEKFILQNDALRLNVTWAAPHSLLYSVVEENSKEKVTDAAQKAAPIARPNTYAFLLESGERKLLIKDGQRPTFSPMASGLPFSARNNIPTNLFLSMPIGRCVPAGLRCR